MLTGMPIDVPPRVFVKYQNKKQEANGMNDCLIPHMTCYTQLYLDKMSSGYHTISYVAATEPIE